MAYDPVKQAFSERLRLALRERGVAVRGPTDLALQFNLRHRGQPVSTQAVHKWLSGKALPTRDKIRTLCEWLGIQESWLLFGFNSVASRGGRVEELPGDVSRLTASLRVLTPRQRELLSAQ